MGINELKLWNAQHWFQLAMRKIKDSLQHEHLLFAEQAEIYKYRYHSLCRIEGEYHLVAIDGTTILVPCHFVKSLRKFSFEDPAIIDEIEGVALTEW